MALQENSLILQTTMEAELGIVADSEARLESWIIDASEMIADYLCRSLYRDSAVVESHYGDGSHFIVVNKAPLNSITSVAYDSVDLASDDSEIHDANGGVIFFPGKLLDTASTPNDTVAQDKEPMTERKLYEVTYDGGWVTEVQKAEVVDGGTATFTAATVNLPRVIRRACIELVSHLRARVGQDEGIASESLLSYSVSYRGDSEDSSGIPGPIRRKLESYRFWPQAI